MSSDLHRALGPKTQAYMKNTKTNRPHPQGYSLLELVLVLAIVSVLVGLLLPKGFDALRNARIQQAEKTAETLKTAIT